MPQSVAFKCTYNDGDNGEYVGLSGTCSRDLIVHNVMNHVWCGQPQNACRKFYEAGMQSDKPQYPCLESELFSKWQFNGGEWHNGPRRGQPIPVRYTTVGKIAILTTRKPDEEESQRKIVGLYEVGEIDDEGNLKAHPDFRIRFRIDEASQLKFWRYYRNSNKPSAFWGSLLFRYLTDDQVHSVMADAAIAVGDSPSKDTIRELIQRHFGTAQPPAPSGVLAQFESVQKRVAIARKYPGGEGPSHLALKNWIAKHPSSIGLPADAKAHIEHVFRSGDCVDIAFRLPDGSWAVVEVETTDPFPGAHQVIKYRALLAAQLGLSLNTEQVRGVLAAWDYTASDLEFCSKYSIEPWKCRVGKQGTWQA